MAGSVKHWPSESRGFGLTKHVSRQVFLFLQLLTGDEAVVANIERLEVLAALQNACHSRLADVRSGEVQMGEAGQLAEGLVGARAQADARLQVERGELAEVGKLVEEQVGDKVIIEVVVVEAEARQLGTAHRQTLQQLRRLADVQQDEGTLRTKHGAHPRLVLLRLHRRQQVQADDAVLQLVIVAATEDRLRHEARPGKGRVDRHQARERVLLGADHIGLQLIPLCVGHVTTGRGGVLDQSRGGTTAAAAAAAAVAPIGWCKTRSARMLKTSAAIWRTLAKDAVA